MVFQRGLNIWNLGKTYHTFGNHSCCYPISFSYDSYFDFLRYLQQTIKANVSKCFVCVVYESTLHTCVKWDTFQ